MAKHMVLTYLHLKAPELPIDSSSHNYPFRYYPTIVINIWIPLRIPLSHYPT